MPFVFGLFSSLLSLRPLGSDQSYLPLNPILRYADLGSASCLGTSDPSHRSRAAVRWWLQERTLSILRPTCSGLDGLRFREVAARFELHPERTFSSRSTTDRRSLGLHEEFHRFSVVLFVGSTSIRNCILEQEKFSDATHSFH